jgi:choline dehydrogenase-like flavoprotein
MYLRSSGYQPRSDGCDTSTPRTTGKAISPGPEIQTDADIERWMKQHTESAYHPCCTAKMGTDEMAVVDAETRVRGVEGLRVVDASIMPSMVRCVRRAHAHKTGLYKC